MKVSIVLPTYNERKNISILIPKIEELLKNNKIESEILVVDDSSPDGTIEEAKRLNKKYKNIRVIVRKKKQGLGAALRAGYNEAKNPIIVSIDADLSFDYRDIVKLIRKIEEGYDLVLASRHMKEGSYEKQIFSTKIKAFVSKNGNKLVKFMTGLPVHDVSANFRAIRKDVWNSIETKENNNSLMFETIIKAHNQGYKVGEIPTSFKERQHGDSKLVLAKEVPSFFLKLVRMTLKYR